MALDKRTRIYGWLADYNGCGFYRLAHPLRELSRLMPRRYGTESGLGLPLDYADYDVIIGQRICKYDDQSDPTGIFIKLASQDQNQLAVYEIDDDLFSVPESSPAYGWYSQEAVQENIRSCATAADMVTVSTEPLSDVMRSINPNVVVVPNYIDDDVLSIPRSRGQRLTIGWGGTSTHDEDFKALGDALDNVLLRNPDPVFMTIGSGRYGGNLPRNRVVRLPWVHSVKKLYPQIARFDIGIAPLANIKFNESKSHIKVLEYMALGIPCVAADLLPYQGIVQHGVTGFLAKNPSDWSKYLNLLVNDEDIREEMGAAARRAAHEWTIQRNIGIYQKVYEA